MEPLQVAALLVPKAIGDQATDELRRRAWLHRGSGPGGSTARRCTESWLDCHRATFGESNGFSNRFLTSSAWNFQTSKRPCGNWRGAPPRRSWRGRSPPRRERIGSGRRCTTESSAKATSGSSSATPPSGTTTQSTAPRSKHRSSKPAKQLLAQPSFAGGCSIRGAATGCSPIADSGTRADVALDLRPAHKRSLDLGRSTSGQRTTTPRVRAGFRGFESVADAARFVNEGRDLVVRLQDELGESWRVEYHPEPTKSPGLRLQRR